MHRASDKVCIAGHRGNPAAAPENTMVGFQKALELGADAIETDVRLSRDRVPILFHDDDLLRITGQAGDPGDRTFAELEALDAGDGATIPTLEELAELCRGRARLILDLKIDGAAAAVTAVLQTVGFDPTRVSACAWTESQAADVQTFLKAARLVHIAEDSLPRTDDAWFRELLAAGYHGLSLAWDLVEPDVVAGAHRHGLTVFTWTINEPADMAAALASGVDGIITDDPAALIQIRSRYAC